MALFVDLLQAILKLGLPIAGLSWFLFAQLYDNGDVDRGADRKSIKSSIKSLRTAFKAKKKRKANIVYDKWMRFGSGFYGLAALWTFVVIEVGETLNFMLHFPGWAVLLADGVLDLAIEVFINQIQNIVSAFVWFGYWEADSIWLWVLVAYLSYWLGIELARREITIPVGAKLVKPKD